MDIILKACGCVLIAVVLCKAIPNERKEFSLLLSIAVCCIVGICAFSFFRPILDFVARLEEMGKLNSKAIEIVLKSMGICVIAEVSLLTCKDIGNGAMGKSLQLMATAAVLWLTLPLFEELITLIENVLGAV